MKARVRIPLALGLAVGTVLFLAFGPGFDAQTIERWVDSAGLAGPLVFIGVYAVATVLLLPGSLLTLAGGALFGPLWGTLANLTGATLGAALAFLAARYLAADWVQSRLRGRTERLVRGVEAEGWRFVAFTRLVPLFPFNLLNYGLGLTRVPFGHYLAATALCMLPGALAYTWLGYAGRTAAAGGEGSIRTGSVALALLAALVFLPRLVARWRQAPWLGVDELKRQIDLGSPPLVLDVRTAADFVGEQGHLAGALNVPLETLAGSLDALGADPERPIALVCRTDRRSAKAAAILARHGFARAQVVRGGMTAWLERGWPVAGRWDGARPG